MAEAARVAAEAAAGGGGGSRRLGIGSTARLGTPSRGKRGGGLQQRAERSSKRSNRGKRSHRSRHKSPERQGHRRAIPRRPNRRRWRRHRRRHHRQRKRRDGGSEGSDGGGAGAGGSGGIGGGWRTEGGLDSAAALAAWGWRSVRRTRPQWGQKAEGEGGASKEGASKEGASKDGSPSSPPPPKSARKPKKKKKQTKAAHAVSATDHGRELITSGYEIEGPIASGAFSTVLRARVRATGMQVAVKSFDEAKCRKSKFLAYARDCELSVLRGLKHYAACVHRSARPAPAAACGCGRRCAAGEAARTLGATSGRRRCSTSLPPQQRWARATTSRQQQQEQQQQQQQPTRKSTASRRSSTQGGSCCRRCRRVGRIKRGRGPRLRLWQRRSPPLMGVGDPTEVVRELQRAATHTLPT